MTDEVSKYLTPQIVPGEVSTVVHFEWDNLNKIITTINGSNNIDFAAGIIMQETKLSFSRPTELALPILEHSKTRSLKVKTPETLQPVHLYSRYGPKFPSTARFTLDHGMTEHYNFALGKYYIWFSHDTSPVNLVNNAAQHLGDSHQPQEGNQPRPQLTTSRQSQNLLPNTVWFRSF